MKCVYCGAVMTGKGGFCPACGKFNLEESQVETPVETGSAAAFLDDDPTAVFSGRQRADIPDDFPGDSFASSTPNADVPVWKTCPQCGAQVETDHTFCGKCGYHFRPSGEVEWTRVIAESESKLEQQYGGPISEDDLVPPPSTSAPMDSAPAAKQPAVKQSPKRKPPEDHTARNVVLAVLITVLVLLLLFFVFFLISGAGSEDTDASSISVSSIEPVATQSVPSVSSQTVSVASSAPEASSAASVSSAEPASQVQPASSSSVASVASQPVESEAPPVSSENVSSEEPFSSDSVQEDLEEGAEQ